MADDADIAGPRIDHVEEAGIARARAELQRSLQPVGRCYFCSSAVPANHTFCEGEECRDDWQHLQDRRKAQGQ